MRVRETHPGNPQQEGQAFQSHIARAQAKVSLFCDSFRQIDQYAFSQSEIAD